MYKFAKQIKLVNSFHHIRKLSTKPFWKGLKFYATGYTYGLVSGILGTFGGLAGYKLITHKINFGHFDTSLQESDENYDFNPVTLFGLPHEEAECGDPKKPRFDFQDIHMISTAQAESFIKMIGGRNDDVHLHLKAINRENDPLVSFIILDDPKRLYDDVKSTLNDDQFLFGHSEISTLYWTRETYNVLVMHKRENEEFGAHYHIYRVQNVHMLLARERYHVEKPFHVEGFATEIIPAGENIRNSLVPLIIESNLMLDGNKRIYKPGKKPDHPPHNPRTGYHGPSTPQSRTTKPATPQSKESSSRDFRAPSQPHQPVHETNKPGTSRAGLPSSGATLPKENIWNLKPTITPDTTGPTTRQSGNVSSQGRPNTLEIPTQPNPTGLRPPSPYHSARSPNQAAGSGLGGSRRVHPPASPRPVEDTKDEHKPLGKLVEGRRGPGSKDK